MQYCFLHHWTLLLSSVTSTAWYCFFFGSIPSFFLELFLHRSPVACWAPTDLGISSFSILSFCLFILFMGVLKARILKWFAIPFSSGPRSVMEVVKQEMATVNINMSGISELKWTEMGKFNSNDHYIYYCGQESLRSNAVHIIVHKRV